MTTIIATKIRRPQSNYYANTLYNSSIWLDVHYEGYARQSIRSIHVSSVIKKYQDSFFSAYLALILEMKIFVKGALSRKIKNLCLDKMYSDKDPVFEFLDMRQSDV